MTPSHHDSSDLFYFLPLLFSYALVWGTSSKHYPQRCGLTHPLEDEDVVQILKKKVKIGEDGRGRFKTVSDKPARIADREKKAPLKS